MLTRLQAVYSTVSDLARFGFKVQTSCTRGKYNTTDHYERIYSIYELFKLITLHRCVWQIEGI